MNIPVHLEAEMPYRGECGFCGDGDARHRIWDAIAERVRAGDDPEQVADDQELSLEYVAWVVEHA